MEIEIYWTDFAKREFVQKFLELQNEEFISKFEKLMKTADNFEMDKKLRSLTEKELNERIAKSEDDFKHGRYKSTDELLAKH